MRLFNVFAAILLVLSMTGCGFHLRNFDSSNDGVLPFSTISIQGSGGSADAIRHKLTMLSNLKQLANAEQAQVSITLSDEKIQQKILAVNRNGRVSDYRLYLHVTYSITYQGKTLLAEGKLQIFRDYSYNDNVILGKQAEKDMLIQDMYHDAATQILRRATALVQHVPQPSPNTAAIVAPTPA